MLASMHEHTTIADAYDVIVIGGGASGLSAALTLGRARRRVLVIDSAEPRNRFAGHMHGVLGHDGLPPLALLEGGREELSRYDVTVTGTTVTQVTDIVRGLRVTCGDGTVEYARSVIVASGIDDELPDVPGLADHWGDAAFQCPYCHGWEVRDRRIGVLATSETVVHHASLIRQWTDRLTVFAVGEEGTAVLDGLDDRTRSRLQARGIRLVHSPVTGVLSTGGTLSGVTTADGLTHDLDAVAVSPVPHPRDGFLSGLDLDRTEFPGVGTFLTVDPSGRTTHPRIWATGNVTQPWLNVPASTGQATMTAAFVNLALVDEDTDAALTAAQPHVAWPDVADDGFWEDAYAQPRSRWSGRPNVTLVDYLSRHFDGDAAPGERGRAADIGCGEGADVVWLAGHGWDTTGVEVSTTAVQRARDAADRAGLADRTRFTDDGLLGFRDATTDHTGLDLVTVSYLHAPSQDHREALLRTAGDLVATGGYLFVLSHVLPGDRDADPLDALGLTADLWTVVRAGTVPRAEVLPGGSVAESLDRALLLRRR